MKITLAFLCICIITSCKNATVDLSSLATSAVPQAAPNISVVNKQFILTVGYAMNAINMVNSGGAISKCEITPALPAGLVFNNSTCQVTGMPIAGTEQAAKDYSLTASNSYGSQLVANIFSLQVLPTPLATISFGAGAGPGSPAGNGSINLTMIDAVVGGQYIQSYMYKLTNPSVSCEDPSLIASVETLSTMHLNRDISATFLDGSNVKVCIVGKNSGGAWQDWARATAVSWYKTESWQDLATMNPKKIIMHDQLAGSTVTSRYFLYSGLQQAVTISCPSPCGISLDNSATFSSTVTLSPPAMNTNIRFRNTVSTAAITTATITVAFVANPTVVIASYSFILRKSGAVSSSNLDKMIFLTKSTSNGNFNKNGSFATGLAAADDFCKAEALKYNIVSSGTNTLWGAMLTTTGPSGTISGLTRLDATINYVDARTRKIIISTNQSFAESFTKFIDGSLTNGGYGAEWEYILNAPRYITATQFWHGSSTCNCSNWTSSVSANTCTNENGGTLSHESAVDLIYGYLPTVSTLGDTLSGGGCQAQHHVVCFEKPF